MGCNCKNKTKPETPKVLQTPPIQVTPNTSVSLEELNTIENMVKDINVNAEKRALVTEFFARNFGDVIVNYCDLICQKRLYRRLKDLRKNL